MTVRLDFKHDYIEALTVKEEYPDLFKGCKNIDVFLKKHKIPVEQFKYTTQGRIRKILPHDTECRKRFTFIRKDYIQDHLLKTAPRESKALPDLPPKIELNSEECFRHEDGRIVDVTIRGNRRPHEIFFNVTDVGKMLEMKNIHANISSGTFIENQDYVNFRSQAEGHNNKAVRYLTFSGLLRIIFTRRHPIADRYIRWSVDILFASQFGTQDQRVQVAAHHMIKMEPQIIKQFLATNVDALPVLYFLYLGTVGELKHKIDIPEHFDEKQQVFKYGVSKDFLKRIDDHENTYMKKYKMNLELKHHIVIDERYIFEAETYLKNYFETNGWSLRQGKDFNELAVISASSLKSTVPFVLRDIQNKYTGKMKDIQESKRKADEKCEMLEIQLAREREDRDRDARYHGDLLREKDERIREKDERLREKNDDFRERCHLQNELHQIYQGSKKRRLNQ